MSPGSPWFLPSVIRGPCGASPFRGGARDHEVVASALAIETSILTNFLLNDAFTFRDWRAPGAGAVLAVALPRRDPRRRSRAARHVLALVAVALERTLGRAELASLRSLAQGVGIAIAFGVNYLGQPALRRGALPGERAAAGARNATPGRGLPRPSSRASSCSTSLPIWLVPYFLDAGRAAARRERPRAPRHAGSPLLQRWYVPNLGRAAELADAGDCRRAPARACAATRRRLSSPATRSCSRSRSGRPAAAARAGGRRSLAFPFVHAFPFHMGFWNFCYGFALAFLTAGFFLRTRGRLGRRACRARGALGATLPRAPGRARGRGRVAMPGVLAWRAAAVVSARPRARAARARVRGYARGRGGALAALPGPGSRSPSPGSLAHRDRRRAAPPVLELAAKLGVGVRARLDRPARDLPRRRSDARDVRRVRCTSLLARAARARALRRTTGGSSRRALRAPLLRRPDVVAPARTSPTGSPGSRSSRCAAWVATGAPRRVACAASPLAFAGLAIVGARDPLREAARALRPGRGVRLCSEAVIPGPRAPAARALAARAARRGRAADLATGEAVPARRRLDRREHGGVDLKNSQAVTNHCPVRFPAASQPVHDVAGSLGADGGGCRLAWTFAAAGARARGLRARLGRDARGARAPCGGALDPGLAAAYEAGLSLLAAARALEVGDSGQPVRGRASARREGGKQSRRLLRRTLPACAGRLLLALLDVPGTPALLVVVCPAGDGIARLATARDSFAAATRRTFGGEGRGPRITHER